VRRRITPLVESGHRRISLLVESSHRRGRGRERDEREQPDSIQFLRYLLQVWIPLLLVSTDAVSP
jgi:hypothetical protein